MELYTVQKHVLTKKTMGQLTQVQRVMALITPDHNSAYYDDNDALMITDETDRHRVFVKLDTTEQQREVMQLLEKAGIESSPVEEIVFPDIGT